MDTATEAAIVMQDVWASTLRQYFSVMGMVLVLYDGLLTIRGEVSSIFFYLTVVSIEFTFFWQIRLVWPGPFSFPKALYYINRYLTAISMLFSTYREQCVVAGRAEY